MKKQIHTDFCAANDPRSIAAMLRGHGDGREHLFNLYQLLRRLRGASTDPVQMIEKYAAVARNPRSLGRLKALLRGIAVSYHTAGIGGTFLLLNHGR